MTHSVILFAALSVVAFAAFLKLASGPVMPRLIFALYRLARWSWAFANAVDAGYKRMDEAKREFVIRPVSVAVEER